VAINNEGSNAATKDDSKDARKLLNIAIDSSIFLAFRKAIDFSRSPKAVSGAMLSPMPEEKELADYRVVGHFQC
jgi:hypothetical protein